MTIDRPFIPGFALSRMLFEDAVESLLSKHAPGLRYAAGLIGSGSDVLAFDDERSTDHDWAPRIAVLVAETVPRSSYDEMRRVFGEHVPATVAGCPTRYIQSPLEAGMMILPDDSTWEAMTHGVTIGTLPDFPMSKWGITSTAHLDCATWLTMSEQHLPEVTCGGVWRDDTGDLAIAQHVDPTPRPFFNRPFQVMLADRCSDALIDAISDPAVLAMPRYRGGIEQYIDTTDGREWIALHLAIGRWLESASS